MAQSTAVCCIQYKLNFFGKKTTDNQMTLIGQMRFINRHVFYQGIARDIRKNQVKNFLVQEICSGVEPGMKEKVWEEWLGFPAMRMVGGYYPLSDKPGLGVEVDEQVLAKYPFQGTKPFVILPLHEDGSIASP